MGFIHVSPVFKECLFKVIPHGSVWERGSRDGHYPVLCMSAIFSDGTSSDVCEGVCGSGVGVSNDWVVGIKELEDFEFMHELIRLRLIAIKDLGFASLEDEFITSNRDDYVRGCVQKGVQVQGRSRWRSGTSILGYYIYRGQWRRCSFRNWGIVFIDWFLIISGVYAL